MGAGAARTPGRSGRSRQSARAEPCDSRAPVRPARVAPPAFVPTMSYKFDTCRFIAEVARREPLYRRDLNVDQGERMLLWREVGQRVYRDWHHIDKAEIYDRLIELQRRWRSLRDAYKRELRLRQANNGTRRRRQYIYYKQLKRILDPQQDDEDPDSGDGDADGDSANEDDEPSSHTSAPPHSDDETEQNVKVEVTVDYDLEDTEEADPLVPTKKSTRRRRTRAARLQKSQSCENEHAVVQPKIPTQVVRERSPVATKFDDEIDSEKLFLLSFAPELSRLPPGVRMWARAQIANIMQEAVTMQCPPSSGTSAEPTASTAIKLEVDSTRVTKYGNML